jgi:hypothetical protein
VWPRRSFRCKEGIGEAWPQVPARAARWLELAACVAKEGRIPASHPTHLPNPTPRPHSPILPLTFASPPHQIGLGLAASVLFVTWTPQGITNFLVRLSLPEVPLGTLLQPDPASPRLPTAGAAPDGAGSAGPDGAAAGVVSGAAVRAAAALRGDSFSSGGALSSFGGPVAAPGMCAPEAAAGGSGADGRAPSPFAALARPPSRGAPGGGGGAAASSGGGGGWEEGDAAEAISGGARLARSGATATLRRGAVGSRSFGRLPTEALAGGGDGDEGAAGGPDFLAAAASLPPPPAAPAAARGHRRAGSFALPGDKGCSAGPGPGPSPQASPPPGGRAHRRTNSLLQNERAPLLAGAGGTSAPAAGGPAGMSAEVARMQQLMLQGWLLLYGCCLLLMLPSFVAWARLPLGKAMGGKGAASCRGALPGHAGRVPTGEHVRRRQAALRARHPSCFPASLLETAWIMRCAAMQGNGLTTFSAPPLQPSPLSPLSPAAVLLPRTPLPPTPAGQHYLAHPMDAILCGPILLHCLGLARGEAAAYSGLPRAWFSHRRAARGARRGAGCAAGPLPPPHMLHKRALRALAAYMFLASLQSGATAALAMCAAAAALMLAGHAAHAGAAAAWAATQAAVRRAGDSADSESKKQG